MRAKRKQKTEALLDAVASLAAAVTDLRNENKELREGIDALLDAFGPEHRAVMEDEAREERRFQEGINSILSFTIGGAGDEAK